MTFYSSVLTDIPIDVLKIVDDYNMITKKRVKKIHREMNQELSTLKHMMKEDEDYWYNKKVRKLSPALKILDRIKYLKRTACFTNCELWSSSFMYRPEDREMMSPRCKKDIIEHYKMKTMLQRPDTKDSQNIKKVSEMIEEVKVIATKQQNENYLRQQKSILNNIGRR